MTAGALVTARARITGIAGRKLGPLPAYAWLLLIVAAYLAYTRLGGAAGQAGGADPLPVVGRAALGEPTAPAAGGGGGTGMPPLPSDLLNNLFGAQVGQIDALTSSLTSTPVSFAAPISEGAPQGALAQEGPASAASAPLSSDDAYWESFGRGLAQTDNPQSTFGPSPYVDYSVINDYFTSAPSALRLSAEPTDSQTLPAASSFVGADLYTVDNQMMRAAEQKLTPGASVAA